MPAAATRTSAHGGRGGRRGARADRRQRRCPVGAEQLAPSLAYQALTRLDRRSAYWAASTTLPAGAAGASGATPCAVFDDGGPGVITGGAAPPATVVAAGTKVCRSPAGVGLVDHPLSRQVRTLLLQRRACCRRHAGRGGALAPADGATKPSRPRCNAGEPLVSAAGAAPASKDVGLGRQFARSDARPLLAALELSDQVGMLLRERLPGPRSASCRCSP